MSIGIEELLPSGAGLITTIIALSIGWNKIQNKSERLEEKDAEQGRQIEAIWKWKDAHEKEAIISREGLNRDISRLEGANLVVNEQFKQIMSILQDIKERIERLENR